MSIILLDLGGVLVNVTVLKQLRAMMPEISEEEIARRWNYETLRTLEEGRCTPQEYGARAAAELGLSMTAEEYLEKFALFPEGFYPGAKEVLHRLRRAGHTLACLTDTSIVQWQSLHQRIGLDTYFDHCFLSYEIGKTKPSDEPDAYVLSRLGCSAEEIYYFDDRPNNIEAGIRAGMKTYRVEGTAELEKKLEELGLI